MGLGIFLDEPDLDERLSRYAGRRLAGLDDEVDSEFVEPEIKRDTFYRTPKEPKVKLPEHEAAAITKARKTKAIANREQRKHPTLRKYEFSTYVIYFFRHPDAQPRDLWRIIKEQQEKKEIMAYTQDKNSFQGTIGYSASK